MVLTVQTWSGYEARALRMALRASVREFAAHLGVSARTVSKWESGGRNIQPRPETQAILDTALEKAGPEAQNRFDVLAAGVRDAEHNGSGNFSTRQVRHPLDGKLMAPVAAGVFLGGKADEPEWLPAFYMDLMPTTNADYARFVADTAHRAPSHWAEGSSSSALRNRPVVNVTYWDACAYATWAKKLLPSSKEWEKAARGNTGNVYPWGDQPTSAKCNVRETGVGHITPVDRYHSGVSPYGNVRHEWKCLGVVQD